MSGHFQIGGPLDHPPLALDPKLPEWTRCICGHIRETWGLPWRCPQCKRDHER